MDCTAPSGGGRGKKMGSGVLGLRIEVFVLGVVVWVGS